MEKNNKKAWLYLLPALVFLGVFMVYPLIDVFIYSFEENFHSVSQTYTGVGFYNYYHVLSDTYFLQALKNTFILVFITVPVSTLLALVISVFLIAVVQFILLILRYYWISSMSQIAQCGLSVLSSVSSIYTK